MAKLIIFTGGGTAGHVLPARAVMEHLAADSDVEMAWIGSRRGIEREMVASWGIPYHAVPSGKLRRYFSVHNAFDLFGVAFGVISSILLLARLKPRLLFSKGGYVSVPPVVAACLLGIPVLTHESDLVPGLATRINARFSRRILVAYHETRELLGARWLDRVLVTGNPVRSQIALGDRLSGLEILGFDGSRPVVLFLGGSLGSAQINQLVSDLLPRLVPQCDIVHQRGSHPAATDDSEHYRSYDFVTDQFPHLLAVADLVVCRAGAGTLWELAVTGKPGILLPLGTESSRGDQIDNARYFADRGAAVALIGPEATAGRVHTLIVELVTDRVRARQMSDAARQIACGDPAGTIAGLIRSMVQE